MTQEIDPNPSPNQFDTLDFQRSDSWDVNAGVAAGVSLDGATGEGHLVSVIAFEDVDGDGRVDHVLKNSDLFGQWTATSDNAKVWVRPNLTGKANLLSTVTLPLGGKISLDYAKMGNVVNTFSTALGSLNVDSPRSKWALSKVTVDDGSGVNSMVDTVDYRMPISGATSCASSSNCVTSDVYDRTEREFFGFGRVTTTHADGTSKRLYFMNQDYYNRGRLLAEYDVGAGSTPTVLRGSIKLRSLDVPPGIGTGKSSMYVTREDTYDVVYDGSITAASIDATDLRGVTAWPPVPADGSMIHYSYRGFDTAGNPSYFVDYGDRQNSADDVNFTIHNATFVGTHFTAVDSIIANPGANTSVVLQQRTATFPLFNGHPALGTVTDLVFRGNQPGTTTPYNGQAQVSTFNSYDAFGNPTSYTDPSGYVLKYTYDSTMNTYLTSVTDSFGYVSSSTPNFDYGLPATTTDENGKVVTYSYDSFGRVGKVWGPTDATTGTATIQMSYSQGAGGTAPLHAWAKTQHKDTSGTIDTVTFVDGLGRLIETKKEADVMVSGTKTQGFSVSGAVVYDVRGRLMSQAQPSFSTATNTTWVAPSTTNATTYTYDPLGRTVDVLLPDGTQTTTSFSTVMPGGSGDDSLVGALGTVELTKVTDGNGHIHRSFRDGADRIAAVKELNTIRGTRKPLVTSYVYDTLGNLTSATDALGNATAATYDSLNRMVTLASLDAGTTEYRYGLTGLLAEKQTGNLRATNKLIKYAYDFNRLKTITYPTLAPVTYTYGASTETGDANGNLAGRLKTITMEGGTEARSYDAFGNVSQTVTTLNQINNTTLSSPVVTMKFSYDWLGRMLKMTFPKTVDIKGNVPTGDGEVVSYAYDHGGLVKKISSSTDTYLADVGYDAFGQRVMLKSGNNVVNNYTYDPKRRFLKTVNATAAPSTGSVPFHALMYGYDLVGNVTTLANAPPTTAIAADGTTVGVGPLSVTYGYDEQDQLTSSTARYRGHSTWGYRYSTTFAYDEIGNLINKAQTDVRLAFKSTDTTLAQGTDGPTIAPTTYTLVPTYAAGHPHQATSVAETPATGATQTRAVSFDANGNGTGDTFGSTTRVNTWDEENRLKSVQVGSSVVSRFLYNPDGERTQRQDSGGKTTFYVNQFLVLHGDGNVTKHIFAGETRVATKMESSQSTTPIRYFYHPDNLGSTSYITDDKQNVVEHDRYFPFGESWVESGLAEKTGTGHREWLFTGKELDGDTGLYYFGARYYDARGSRWMSTDPELSDLMQHKVGRATYMPQNLGVYSYGWNRPVSLKDPDGRFLWEMVLESPIGEYLVNESEMIGVQLENAFNAVGMWVAYGSSSVAPPLVTTAPPEATSPILARNPWGQHGDPDHQATVKDLVGEANAKYPGHDIQQGTSIKGDTGVNRKPDVTVRDPKTRKVVEVYEAARTNKSGDFVNREQKKKAEYDAARIPSTFRPVTKTAKDPVSPAPQNQPPAKANP